MAEPYATNCSPGLMYAGNFNSTVEDYQSLLALARSQGAVGTTNRGACKKCGQLGHLTKQCRNDQSVFFSRGDQQGAAPAGVQLEKLPGPPEPPGDDLSSLSSGLSDSSSSSSSDSSSSEGTNRPLGSLQSRHSLPQWGACNVLRQDRKFCLVGAPVHIASGLC